MAFAFETGGLYSNEAIGSTFDKYLSSSAASFVPTVSGGGNRLTVIGIPTPGVGGFANSMV